MAANEEVRKIIDEMLDDPTCEVSIEQGFKEVSDPTRDVVDSYEPIKGCRTLTMTTGGGVKKDEETQS